MLQSSTIGKLAEALAKVQAEIKTPIAKSNNPYFKSPYADLEAIKEVTQPVLASHGLALSQVTEMQSSGEVILITLLMHVSGEYLCGIYPIRPAKNDPQSMGSALTYARRYAKLAILDLPPKGEEDDGEAATNRGEPPHSPPPTKIGDADLERLFKTQKDARWPPSEAKLYIKASFAKDSSRDLTLIELNRVCDFIKTHPYPLKKNVDTDLNRE